MHRDTVPTVRESYAELIRWAWYWLALALFQIGIGLWSIYRHRTEGWILALGIMWLGLSAVRFVQAAKAKQDPRESISGFIERYLRDRAGRDRNDIAMTLVYVGVMVVGFVIMFVLPHFHS